MPLRGTIESVYKGTLVYAREHNPIPTLVGTHGNGLLNQELTIFLACQTLHVRGYVERIFMIVYSSMI